ncbi:sortase-dependent protein [Kitasatospora sp. NPDC096147]|uniref:sortase-dependent protein n=1 Tax=Kitasatospora sp. NPDC096147 TaxID=3364093 RepID=UPI0037F350DF
MAGTTTVRRALRLALVSAGVAGTVALSGAVAHADGSSPAPAAPSASVSPTAPAAATEKPAVTPAPVKPSASPSKPTERDGSAPQVKVVPKGGAQTGEGEAQSSTTLVVGSGLAALGAAGLGFAVLRRRAGARG